MIRHLKLAILAVFGTLLVTLLGLGLLTRIALARVDLPDVEHRLSQATGLDAHVAGLGVDWKGLVLLKNVTLSWHGHTILTTPEAGLRVAVWEVWNTGPDVLFLRLRQPVLQWDDPLLDWWHHSPPVDPNLHLRVSIQEGVVQHGPLRISADGSLTLSLPTIEFDVTAHDNSGGHYGITGDSSDWSGHLTSVSLSTFDARLPDLNLSGSFSISGQSGSGDWTVLGHALHTEARWTSDTLHCAVASDPLSLICDIGQGTVSGTFSNGGPPISFEGHGQWGEVIDVTLGEARAHLEGASPNLRLSVDGPLPLGFPSMVHAQAWQDAVGSAQLTASATVAAVPITAAGRILWQNNTGSLDLSVDAPSGDHGTAHFQYNAGRVATHIEIPSLHVKGSMLSGIVDFTRDAASNTSLTGHLKSSGDLGGDLNLDGYWGQTDNTGLRFDAPAPTWQGRTFLPFHGIVTFNSGLIHLDLHIPALFPGLDLTLDFDPIKHSFQARTELKGQTADLLFPMVSPGLPNLRGNLFGVLLANGRPRQPSVTFTGRLVHGDLGRLALGDGTIALEVQPPAVDMKVDANLGLQALGIIHDLLPGLEGQGKLHVSWRGRSQPVTGTLRAGSPRLAGNSLGPLQARFHKQGDDLHIDSVTLPYTRPPVVLTGDWNPKTRHLHFAGSLHGAQIAVPTLNLKGPLTGPVDIDGTPETGRLEVAGQVVTW